MQEDSKRFVLVVTNISLRMLTYFLCLAKHNKLEPFRGDHLGTRHTRHTGTPVTLDTLGTFQSCLVLLAM